MKKTVMLLLAVLLYSGIRAQGIQAVTAAQLIQRTSSKDTVYIINFWATWCAPCVGELPEFNKLYSHYEGQKVKVLMVSLDFKESYPDGLAHFARTRPLHPEIAWLAETDPNVFIPQIENSWQGSIPATLIVAPGQHFKQFIESTITEKQIKKIVDQLLK